MGKKKNRKQMNSTDVYHLLWQEVYVPLVDKPTKKQLKKLWKPAFIRILRNYYGFNKKAAETMFDWGSQGHNWSALHHTFEESLEEVLESFTYEVRYICDRISLDRLLRTHHMYNHYFATLSHIKFKKEDAKRLEAKQAQIDTSIRVEIPDSDFPNVEEVPATDKA